AHAVAVPDGEVVVLHDRVLDLQLPHGVHDLVERLLPRELGAVHADDGEPLLGVPLVPVPQLRDDVFAVVSAERPELDQHDTAAWGSIVIPARNDAAALSRTLEALERLEGASRAEIVIAASGDPDGTTRAAGERVRLLWPEGATRAALLNAGAAAATGEVLF